MSTTDIKTEDTAFDPTTVEIEAVTASSALAVPASADEDVAPKSAPPPFTVSAAAPGTASSSAQPPEPAVPSPVMTTTKTKSKKKKQPAVTMATATTATSGSSGAQGENTGRWTAEEHRLFLQGLDQHGKGWKKIASLIKSRTVVQIRTHAQKYFQKLAKARQNGDDGDVSMEGRGGPAAVATVSTSGLHSTKRRRQTTGTKRKAISSVVASAQRQGKRLAAAQEASGVSNPTPPLPAVAPALAPFVPPSTLPSITTANGTISGPALEDSLFRFLTPAPTADPTQTVNEVARQAGANPITLPSENPTAQPVVSGEVSPTGVNDLVMYPSWADAKDMPSWYAKGADVDCLLDVADTLDWLTDTGDLHETYEPPKVPLASPPEDSEENKTTPNLSTDALAAMDSDTPVEALPSLFENAEPSKKQDSNLEEHLNVFDTPMEEHAFVTALLENNGESSGSLPVIS